MPGGELQRAIHRCKAPVPIDGEDGVGRGLDEIGVPRLRLRERGIAFPVLGFVAREDEHARDVVAMPDGRHRRRELAALAARPRDGAIEAVAAPAGCLLNRTRHRIAERLIGLDAGEVLTPANLARARRRIAELPSAWSTRLDFAPVPSGLAEIRGAVAQKAGPLDWPAFIAQFASLYAALHGAGKLFLRLPA